MGKIKKEEKELISLTEATKYCNYSQEYLSLRARSKKLKSVKVGRNWMTTTAWLNEYLQRVDQYKEQVSGKPNQESVQEVKAVFAQAPADNPVPIEEPTPTEPSVEESPAEIIEEPKVEEAPVEPEPIVTPPVEIPAEPTTEELVAPESPQPPVDGNLISFKKEIAPPDNLPSEDELLKKYMALDYPVKNGLRFSFVTALTVTLVVAGFVFGAGSFSAFLGDAKQYSDLVMSGSHTIGRDLSESASYSLSFSSQIFGQYVSWLSSLFF